MGGSFWLCSPLVRFTLVLIILVLFGMLVVYLMVVVALFHLSLSMTVDLLLLIERMIHLRGLDTVRISKVKGHADEGMVLDGRVREVDRLGNDAADEAPILGVGELAILSLMLVVTCLGSVVAGTLLFLIFIVFFSLPYLVLWSIMMVVMVLLLILVWSAFALPKRRRLVLAVRDWVFFAWAAWYLAFKMVSSSCFCHLC